MKVADLFCKAGGAAVGLRNAGIDEIVGFDVEPQPRYPFEFHQQDALTVDLAEFDAIWASPPCWWTRARHLREAQGGHSHKSQLIEQTRTHILSYAKPYIIENVPGAPMRPDVVLCGSMFGLQIRRHRWFESNVTMPLVSPCNHVDQGRPIGVYHQLNDEIPHGGKTAKNLAEASDAMGINWMVWDELKEAVPPVYSELLGKQFILGIKAMSA